MIANYIAEFESNDELQALSLNHLQSAFYLWSAGILMSILAFIIEVLGRINHVENLNKEI